MSDSSIDIEDFYMNYNNAIMNSYEMDAIQKHYDCGLTSSPWSIILNCS
jgi:hypothetical protein